MLLNYLKVTARTLLKTKGYTLINILGLAIGLACFAMILIFMENERSYDTFNPRGDRVYRVVGILKETGLGEYHNAVTQGILGPTMEQELPAVEAVARLLAARSPFVSNGDVGFYEDRVMYADPAVFDVLAVDWQQASAGSHDFRAEFQKVVWVRDEGNPSSPGYLGPTFTPQYTPVGSTDFKTDSAGQARAQEVAAAVPVW